MPTGITTVILQIIGLAGSVIIIWAIVRHIRHMVGFKSKRKSYIRQGK